MRASHKTTDPVTTFTLELSEEDMAKLFVTAFVTNRSMLPEQFFNTLCTTISEAAELNGAIYGPDDDRAPLAVKMVWAKFKKSRFKAAKSSIFIESANRFLDEIKRLRGAIRSVAVKGSYLSNVVLDSDKRFPL